MKNPQGVAGVAIVLLALAIGLGWLYANNHTALINNPSIKKASATIDPRSLTVNTPTPIITGTCQNLYALEIVIVKGKVSLPQNSHPRSPDTVVYDDVDDHGGHFDTHCMEQNGTFSTHFNNPKLEKGTYTVGIYAYLNEHMTDNSVENMGITLITSDTLIVK